MKEIIVQVCAGTHCTMMGAMDIMDAIASLKELNHPALLNQAVKVEAVPCLDNCKQDAMGPVVKVAGQLIERADSESVMAAILSASAELQK